MEGGLLVRVLVTHLELAVQQEGDHLYRVSLFSSGEGGKVTGFQQPHGE